jgi:SAM-dependent methyltransferase
LNHLYRRWRYLRSVGVRYPIFLLRKAAFGHELDRRALSRFSGYGLEIGGPSNFFKGGREFPIYSAAQKMDNVNYSSKTFWEGTLEEGKHFRYSPNKAAGHQFICEASDLSAIPDCSYDFVASCHTLEHCANPIKALIEWRRVLTNDGWVALVLPHKVGTFDHRRRATEFEHLVKDYTNGVTEDDETHFAEILEKHDLDRDLAQESRKTFEKWIDENTANRGAHHHVFDPALAIRLLDHVGFEVAAAEVVMPFHIFIVAQKSDKSGAEKEKARHQILEACCAASPFEFDRQRRAQGLL